MSAFSLSYQDYYIVVWFQQRTKTFFVLLNIYIS